MTGRKHRLAGVLGIAFGLLATAAFAQDQKPAEMKPSEGPSATDGKKVDGPRIKLSQTTWNFGEVWYGEPAETSVNITNVGSADLTLDVKTSCGCTAVHRPKRVLKPGESDALQIRYNTKKRQPSVRQTVTINSNDPVEPELKISVIGTVKQPYQSTPTTGLSFGRLPIDAQQTREMALVNTTGEKIFLKLKPFENEAVDIKLEEVEPGMKYKVIATTKPPLPAGNFYGKVEFETSNPKVPTLDFPVNGLPQLPVAVAPDTIYIAPTIDRPTRRYINLSYAEGREISIKEARSTSDKIKVSVQPRMGHTGGFVTDRIMLDMPPANEIPEGTKIIVDTSDPQYSHFEIEVTSDRTKFGMAKRVRERMKARNDGGTGNMAPVNKGNRPAEDEKHEEEKKGE